jgi:hypothetical protein
MKTWCLHSASAHSTVAHTLLSVVFAAGLTAMTLTSALGQENDWRNSPRYGQSGRQDEQRGDHQRSHANQRAQQEQHNRYQRRYGRQDRQYGYEERYQRAYQSYGYADPAYVYAPPPVVYEPRPSPGVTLFFGF